MFDYNKMIQRAVQFFPTWSDIRKRYKTSTGGKLIGSTLEEICELEDAIKEYTKYYFLDTYEGHEDEIVAFSYKFAIGIIDDLTTVNVKYKKENIVITEDIDKLLAYNLIAYYEGGNIYINDSVNPSDISIFINKDKIDTIYDLVSVWNIFDEFACFVDVQRHPGETNSQLVKRILYRTRYKPNASIKGLQNAIMTELLTEFPNISRDEIQIEQVNDENLRQAYKDFDTLLDFLNSINCDVYRWKRWDLNEWKHNFKSISYIPTLWNESITNFKNGIGYNDDCKVSIASNIQKTDATITLYNKSKETMNKYLADKKLEKDITFQFKKYNDILNFNTVNYTIQAAKLSRLYPEKIKMNMYQKINTVSEVPVSSIFKFGHGIIPNRSNCIIEDAYPYRFKFEPKNNNKDIEISECTVTYVNTTTNEPVEVIDLLKNKTGFKINAFGSLVSNSIRKSITKVEDFDSKNYNNFKNLDNNKGIQMTGTIGTGVKTLYNLGGQKVSYNASCELSLITKEMDLIELDSVYGVWDKNNINFYPNDLNKKAIIKLKANQFSFDVLSNNTVDVMVRYNTKGNYDIIEKAASGTTWKTKKFDMPQYMEIVISSKAKENIKIGNFKYSNYTIKFQYKTANDSTYRDLYNNILPINNNISFKVIVSSSSGSNPIIHGIYIGSNLKNTTYVTDSFPPKNNTYREIEITTNAKVTLVKRDIFDSKDVLYTENYDPIVSYIAKDNDAYIRLDLSEYSNINNINTTIGQIQKTEESGASYYNLLLTKGQEIKRITIDGIKDKATYEVTLLDIINKELKEPFNITKDTLYCSLLTKGVIVIKNSDKGQTQLLSLNSSLFYGADGIRYEFVNIPDNIGVVWGVGDGLYSDSVTGSFDYVSFYEEGSVIHTAHNSYNLFINEMKNVSVAENFTYPDLYNNKLLYFYTVTTNTDNTGVRFYNYLDEGKTFDDLVDWSIGLKNLYIKNTNDYNNESIYSISVLDYTDKCVLNEYIDLKESYDIANNNTIYTEQYIVVPPKGMTVRYKTYDGTTQTEKLLKTEIIVADGTMFKKLQYSNIDKILSIKARYKNDNVDVYYNLLNDEGIIVWNKQFEIGTIIELSYTIKKPVALVFDLDLLYKLTGYTVETYKKLNTYYLSDINNGSTYDLRNFNDYEDSDLAYIQCKEPTFESQMLDEYIVKFNKHMQEKSVLVKTGYYYFNGVEYYLFSEKGEKQLRNNRYIIYNNVDVNDEYLHTYKRSNNYVRNSEMLTRNINDLYSYDCNIPIESPKYNKYTACDSYNNWNTFNTTLTLTEELYLKRLLKEEDYEGFNNVALKLTANKTNAINYAYINITENISNVTYLTLAATSNLTIYIAEEFKLGKLDPKTALSIIPIHEVKAIHNSYIRTCKFNTKPDTRYYLIVIGEGVIDDIVMSDSLVNTVNYHIKNIEKLGFYFNESKVEGTTYKMRIDDNFNSINSGASLCSDHYIRTVGNITWNATKVKTYNTMEDFLNPNCYKDVELIISDYIKSPSTTSCRFVTDYIEINPKVINRLFVKVNDVLINNMDNFKITLLGTSNKKAKDIEITTVHNHFAFAYGNELLRFVKAQIEIPENYVVDKIEFLIEYKSDKDNAPILTTPLTGSVISPVYDSQQALNYSVKNININDISNINDVDIYIRAMTEDNTAGVWSLWNKLELINMDGKVIYDSVNTEKFSFNSTPVRYFQFKIILKSRSAYINLDSIDIEVVN